MKAKKVLSLVLAAAMTLSLVACGNSKEEENNTPAPESSAPADNGSEEAKEPAAGEQTLKVAAVETAYGAQMWQDVCAAFEKANPGVKVELTIDKKLEDIITPAMKAGDYPDVIMRAVGAESALTETFIKDNNVVEMTDVLAMTVPGEDVTVGEKILPGFVDNSITNPYGDGKTYLMPMFYGPCGLFYDAGLFEAKGWTVPTTWDEMWELGDKAKAEGIALFTYPTAGYFDAFFYALLRETAGNDKFQEALRYGEGAWDTPEAQQTFDIIAKLASYTEKTTPANANDNDFRKNQQLVLDDKALFMPNGNWVIGEMADAPRAEGFKWGFTALPAVTEGGDRASYTFFEQIWMPKGAVNQDLGKQFIAYLYSDEAAEIFASGETPAVQPIKGMADKLEGDNKIYYSIYDTGAIAVMDAFATTDPVEGVTVRTTFFDPINSLVSGDKTEEQWVEQVKKDSDALRAALK
ncbi:carbohydrate ABC transporter substrate-binding protein [Diplocloster agilis]|uniref:Carbohydrate ABC transporter substrate-binding protein n=1 Tax=Diplocloster agilis TaxID=2850323 RepID=A0A949NGN4_9FIRM|nr:carbohydrate ABC transporter substrate-binding protein [Diplocloster agilis]MBU9736728.1 carbohydrate ABC transporter substrate-binding protein [Diplocloster agilis]MBU9743547.1 carbohydrate ABC transporter substrate-binding protein [Diplocloster agilis]